MTEIMNSMDTGPNSVRQADATLSGDELALPEALSQLVLNIDRMLRDHSPEQVFDAISKLEMNDEYHNAVLAIIVSLKSRLVNLEITQNLLINNTPEIQGFSHVPYPLGFRSSEDSAVLGRDGFIFLISGSNKVLDQYSPYCVDAETLGQRWVDLLNVRINEASKRGVLYRQILVPEKISIIPELFPQTISVPTRLLARVEKQIEIDGLSWAHISGFEIFCRDTNKHKLCKRFDSHLAPLASFKMFQYITRSVADYIVKDLPFDSFENYIGDLGFRMFGAFLPEAVKTVSFDSLPTFCTSAQKVSENIPLDGGFRGRRQIWRNESAPIDKRIVVFGNSYFSFAENGQSGLSWWCSRWFKEYHFIWTNEVEWDYVDNVSPDIVLWQGVERFLPLMPAS